MGQTNRRGALEAEIARIARRQKWLITARQLAGAGLSRNAISARSRSRRLFRVHRGVFSLHPPPLTREQRWLAAVLACGSGALLTDEPSALLQRLAFGLPAAPQVAVPGQSGRRLPFTVHRRDIDPRDVRHVDSVPCTSADRILVDLAPKYPEDELERIMVAAQSLGFLRRVRLAELVAERRGRPGMPKLQRLLALRPRIARSELELMFDPVWRSAGLERLLFCHPIAVGGGRTIEVDLVWPSLRMAVELDSQRFHGDWESAARDRERDQLLALADWRCHRFVRDVVVGRPEACAERLRALASAGHASRV